MVTSSYNDVALSSLSLSFFFLGVGGGERGLSGYIAVAISVDKY